MVLAIKLLPRAAAYTVAGAIMLHARQRFSREITRQVAQNIMEKARTRLRVDFAEREPDLGAYTQALMHALWKEAEQNFDRRTRVELIKVQATLMAGQRAQVPKQDAPKTITYEVVGHDGAAGGGAADDSHAGPADDRAGEPAAG